VFDHLGERASVETQHARVAEMGVAGEMDHAIERSCVIFSLVVTTVVGFPAVGSLVGIWVLSKQNTNRGRCSISGRYGTVFLSERCTKFWTNRTIFWID
jgi:hypothetical protein